MTQFHQLAASRPSEVALSPDGSTLYAAGADGVLRVYSVKTGALLYSWQVGTNLGGLDLAPDGSFLMVVERQPRQVSEFEREIKIYKVDTATGETASYPYLLDSSLYSTFFDVAVMSNGKALISQNFNGSGWVQLKILDLATGTYTVGTEVRQSSVLTRSGDGSRVLIGEPNSSDGPLKIYDAGAGVIASRGSNGFNWGIQAFSASGGLVAQYIYNEGIHVYNGALQSVTTLQGPPGGDWRSGRVTDLAFDGDGEHLFVLDNGANTIVQVRVSDWTVVQSIAVGADVGGWAGQIGATAGSRLIVDPLERYFSVVTDGGLILVANPDAPPMVGTEGADVLIGTLFDDVIEGLGGDDYIDGGAGADTMTGGTGNDIYIVDDAGDQVVELAGEGTDEIRTGLATAGIPYHVENFVGTSASRQTVHGNVLGNVISLGSGNDVAYGNGGDDIIFGNDGDDYLVGGYLDPYAGAAPLPPGNDTLYGGAGNDTLIGWTGNDTLHGGDGDDWINGYGGADTAWGGGGNDIIFAGGHGGNAVDVAHGGDGADTLRAGYGTVHLYGDAGDDLLIFFSSFDSLDIVDGGEGNDTMSLNGNYGPLTLSGTNISGIEILLLLPETGGFVAPYNIVTTDSLVAAGASLRVVADTLRASEPLTFNGSSESDGHFEVLGGFGADIIVTGNGNDFLDGGGGADRLTGGLGDDTYVVDDLGDVVIEAAGEGIDQIRTGLTSYVLPEHFEILTMTGGAGPRDLRGNAADNRLTGAASSDFIRLQDGGDDVAYGLGGHDAFYFGGAFGAGDRVDGGEGNDQVALQGDYSAGLTLAADTLVRVETIALLSGLDTRFGDTAGNLYDYVLTTHDANVAAGGQLTIDAAQLAAGEDFRFDGRAETDGSFYIYAGKGNDDLKGGAQGDVFLFRSDGRFTADDRVDGGAGTDQLALRGNYSGANAIVMQAGTMANIEVLAILSGNNTWFGPNAGNFSYDITMHDANVASGATLIVDAAQLREGESLVFDGRAETEGAFRVFGGLGADVLTGGAGNDILSGRGGDDVLAGGLGNDRLTGGAGADVFRFDTALDGAANVDAIADFSVADDTISLSRAIFSAIGSDGTLAAGAFREGTMAEDSDDRILYDSATGRIFYDADGGGGEAAILFATVTGGTELTHLDFSAYTPVV